MPNTIDEFVKLAGAGVAERPLTPSLTREPGTIEVETPLSPPFITEETIIISEKKKEENLGSALREATKGRSATPAPGWISPKQHDTLFWCLYSIHFGYNDYHQIARNYGIRLLETKKKISTWIQENPSKLKQTNYKMTKASVQEILSDCLTGQKETNMLCLLGFLAYFNMNVLILDNSEKLLLEFIGSVGMDNHTYLLKKDSYNKYSIKEEPLSSQEITELKSTHVLLDSYEKPLKTISNYKVDDLTILARKLGVFEEGKKYKKAELYSTVLEACSRG